MAQTSRAQLPYVDDKKRLGSVAGSPWIVSDPQGSGLRSAELGAHGLPPSYRILRASGVTAYPSESWQRGSVSWQSSARSATMPEL